MAVRVKCCMNATIEYVVGLISDNEIIARDQIRQYVGGTGISC